MRNRILVALLALLAIGLGLWQLTSATRGLVVGHERIGATPVTIYRPVSGAPAPLVVIAHGFAGSQQLMQPFAVTLARNGYLAATFDFPGHAQSGVPLPGGFEDENARSEALLAALDLVVEALRGRPYSDGRLALLGHSMGSDIVARYAQRQPEVAATVGVSLFFEGVTPDSPRNLLIINGALENPQLQEMGFRIVGAAAGGQAQEAVTYGNFGQGTARRIALADGTEHIAVLYSRESMAEALDWLDATFGRRNDASLDGRGPWLGLLYLGLIALAWPLSGLLPRLSAQPLGAGYNSWRRLLLIASAPAVLTPLILWRLPSDFLPIILADYLLLHFGLYGMLSIGGMLLLKPPGQQATQTTQSTWSHSSGQPWLGLALASIATASYSLLAFGLPAHWFVTSYLPGPGRWPVILAMLVGTLPYFVADEWLTRGGPRGVYAVTKALFLGSLALAIALNLYELFFLVIIVPAILAYFIVYGLISSWIYQRTLHPLVGALSNALVFAWVLAVTFPIVAS